MTRSFRTIRLAVVLTAPFLVVLNSCAPPIVRPYPGSVDPLHDARQLVTVVTSDWDSSAGQLQAFERSTTTGAWTPVREPVALILGGRGLGWGDGLHGQALDDGPVKR